MRLTRGLGMSAASQAVTNWQDYRFVRPKVAASEVGYTDAPHEINGLKEHVGIAVARRSFELVANESLRGERQPLL